MSQDGNAGVTEARFALTIVTCLLLALGYITLHRLGGAGEMPPVEIGPAIASQPPTGADDPIGDSRPQVLPIQGADATQTVPHTSQRLDRPEEQPGGVR